jgi:predicted nucleotidyltransferase
MLASKTKRKIVEFMLTHTASMSEREIASILKISHMSINRTMAQFAELNLVSCVTVGKAHMWRVNRKSYIFKIIAQLFKNNLIVNNPIEDLRLTLLRNIPKSLIKKIVLFGSIAKGTEKTDSDIDIFILTRDSGTKDKLESHIDRLVNICLEVYGNRLAPYVLTEQELKSKKNLEVVKEINKGIVIFP